MHVHDLSPWQHRHDFATGRGQAESRTRWVIGITLVMMAAEIAAGWWWHSMALLADGWHMGTHAAAIGVAALSYALARRWAGDARFSLGPWKVEVLGAYTSAVLLGVVALGIALESGLRLWTPQPVAYDESIVVAVIGLLVNAICVRLLHVAPPAPASSYLKENNPAPAHAHADAPTAASASASASACADAHAHAHAHSHPHAHARARRLGHNHGHGHEHGQPAGGGTDLNLRGAYLHVLADAATSVLAIGALLAGKWAGWTLLDPLIGLLGGVLIAWWSIGLLRQSSRILLDREMDDPLADLVRERLESDGDARVADLHLWRVGDARFACQATLVADAPLAADTYRERLQGLPALAHVVIEINRCRGPAGAVDPGSRGRAGAA